MERGVLDGRTHKIEGKQGVGPESNLQRVFRKCRLQDLFGDSHKIYSPITLPPFCAVSFLFPAERQKLFLSCMKRGKSTPLPSFSGSQNAAALEEIPCLLETIPRTLSLEQTPVLSWLEGGPGLTWPRPMPPLAQERWHSFLEALNACCWESSTFRNCSKMVSNSQEGDIQVYLMGEEVFVCLWLGFRPVTFF